jgi:hypothetical protein
VLSPIATTKSTVLGLRLDHDRRAWVEAIAVEQGVSVRAVFEALIDRARADELADEPSFAERDYDSGQDAHSAAAGGVYGAQLDAGPSQAGGNGPAGATATADALGPQGPVQPATGPVLCIRKVVAFSGHMLGVAGSLVRGLVEANGQHARACARDNWRIISRSLQ